jgi:hypothetical protein
MHGNSIIKKKVLATRPRLVVFLIIIPLSAAALDRAHFRTIELDRDIEKLFPEQS